MCGIAGKLDFRNGTGRAELETAARLLSHRGPDGEGLLVEGPAGLVHRRLAIIDLQGGAQPMYNEDRTLVLVCNGEIYNYRALRSELITRGHRFATRSDSEVIVHGFEQWGPTCVEKFQGMFAFALYDRVRESLFLARDRCGEKPLYYARKADGLSFSSEIDSLRQAFGHTSGPDPAAAYLYLRLGYIPAPHSFYREVNKLEPGACLSFRRGEFRRWSYYRPRPPQPEKGLRQPELCRELESALGNSVRKMLMADVPLGAFLSGGLDSSLIVALMAREGGRPRTFSISFEEGSFDESGYARLVARHLGTEHSHYRLKLDDFEAALSLMDGFGEPLADSSAIPTYHLARETRGEVKVALSGDGADELFGGYRRYLAQGPARYCLSLPRFFRQGLIARMLAAVPEPDVYYADSPIKSARIFLERAESARDGTRGLMLNTVFAHQEIRRLFPELPDGRPVLEAALEGVRQPDLAGLMQADRMLYLPDDILCKLDRMSMRNSLEVRAPFLDPELLELSDRIPMNLKMRRGRLKHLLREVAMKYLPPEIVHRKKHGFVLPLAGWLKRMGEGWAASRMPAGARPGEIRALLSDHFRGKRDNSSKLFALMVLSRFLDR